MVRLTMHVRIPVILLEVPASQQIASLHIEMDLRRCDRGCVTRFSSVSGSPVHRIGAADIRNRGTDTGTDLTRLPANITHGDGDYGIGVAGRDPRGHLNSAALVSQANEIGKLVRSFCVDESCALFAAGLQIMRTILI